MKPDCRKNCRKAIDLSKQLLDLTSRDNSHCDHDACMVLCGIILDSASVIRREAEKRLAALET